jgi:hypothetical protein
MTDFDTILSDLCDYYGNFAEEPQFLKLLQPTMAFRQLSEDELDFAAAGDIPRTGQISDGEFDL